MSEIKAQLDPERKRLIKPAFLPVGCCRGQHQGMLAPKTNTGQIIRDALKRLHKTQAWLAEQCGVSNNAVSLWIKTGEVGPC